MNEEEMYDFLESMLLPEEPVTTEMVARHEAIVRSHLLRRSHLGWPSTVWVAICASVVLGVVMGPRLSVGFGFLVTTSSVVYAFVFRRAAAWCQAMATHPV